jgi:hypothetical protein
MEQQIYIEFILLAVALSPWKEHASPSYSNIYCRIPYSLI